MMWEELGPLPMDSEELMWETSGMALTGGSDTDSSRPGSCSENGSQKHEGWRAELRYDSLSLDTSPFSTDDVAIQRRRAKRRKGNLVRRSGGSAHGTV